MFGGENLDRGRIGAAEPERCLPGPIVNPFAQAFQCSRARQSGERLGDGFEGQIPKVFQTPDTFAARIDPLPDGGSDVLWQWQTGSLSHTPEYGLPGPLCQVFML